jgi:geranylgeranyl diphosphate/geranylgeranyl-bacteriochlorophyllide a reductase
MTNRNDVAIVGAGPAGAWLGYLLARAGASVTLIDGSHPREKPCGGGVTARALRLVADAVSTHELRSVSIEGTVFERGDVRTHVAFDRSADGLVSLVVVARREFDDLLLRKAIAAGARFVSDRVVRVDGGPGAWRLHTRRGISTSDWLVGADGANSLVRRTVSIPFPRTDLSIAAGWFVRDRTAVDIVIGFEADGDGYLWSFPRADHLAVGICAQADRSSSAALAARAAAWIRTNVAAGASRDRYSWPIPSLTEEAIAAERPSGAGWMLVGDAAGLVDPITREGIYFALRSAVLAAEALAGSGSATAYAHAVGCEIYDELSRAARAKRRFFNPRFTMLLMRGLQHSPRIRRVMADLIAGRQAYRGLKRRLLATMELRLMCAVLRAES